MLSHLLVTQRALDTSVSSIVSFGTRKNEVLPPIVPLVARDVQLIPAHVGGRERGRTEGWLVLTSSRGSGGRIRGLPAGSVASP